VPVIVALAIVFLFSACSTELFETVEKMVDFAHRDDKVAPVVIFTTPSYGTQGVPKNIIVTVTFDEAMDPDTINDTTFTVETGSTAQPGSVAYLPDHNMAIWTPTFDFYSNTVYTGRLSTDIRDASGNRLQSEYTWTFQTGETSDGSPPTIDFNFPNIGALDVGINIDIVAGFTESLDPSSVNGSTFGLFQGTNQVEGAVHYFDSSYTVVFVPSAELLPGASYTARASGSIRDLAGNALGSNVEWSFTTGATSDTDPPSIVLATSTSLNPVSLVNSVNVQVDDRILVQFDEDMNPETINSTTFYVEGLEGPVPGEVVYVPSSRNAVLNFFDPMNKMEIHTAYVSGAVEDVAGNQMGSSVSCQFMTVSSETSITDMTANIVNVQAGPDSGELTAYVLVTNQSDDPLPGLLYLNFEMQERVNADTGPYTPVASQTFTMGASRESKSVVFVVDDTPTMEPYWGEYMNTLASAVTSLNTHDKAEFITYASENPFTKSLTVYPPGDIPPQSNSLTADKDVLIYGDESNDGLMDINPKPYNYSFVCDAIGYGMDDLSNQDSDEMRALDAVIAFTDAAEPNFLYDEWGVTPGIPLSPPPPNYVIDYANANSIPIYSIAFQSATGNSLMQQIGTSTSGFYYPATVAGQLQDAYFQALSLMDGGLRELYTVTWKTEGRSGDDVDVSMRVNYAHTDEFFSDTDVEDNYDMP
jgi:hypothetical protein